MRKLLIGIGAVLILLVLAVVAAPFVIPSDRYRPMLEARGSAATGRALHIAGDLRVSLVPVFGLVANDVTLANPPGSAKPDMVQVKRVEIAVRPWPLLSGRVVVDRLLLDQPAIDLEIDPAGHGNWVLAPASPPPPGPAPAAGRPTQPSTAGVSIAELRLDGGRIDLLDRRSGRQEQLDGLDLTLRMPAADGPLTVDGHLSYRQQPIDLRLAASQAGALLSGRASDLSLTLASAPVSAAFNGSAGLAPDLSARGGLDLSGPSLGALLAWLERPAARTGGLGPFHLHGQVDLGPGRAALSGATAAIDRWEATGAATLSTTGARPAIKMDVAVNALDLDVAAPASPAAPVPAPAAHPSLPQPTPPANPGVAAPNVRPAPDPAPTDDRWSDASIDLGPLRGIDADATIELAGLKTGGLALGHARIHAVDQGGRAVLDVADAALADGTGDLHTVVDASGSGAAPWEAHVKLAKVRAGPLLRGVAAGEPITGTVTGEADLTSRGDTPRALIAGLAGRGTLAVAEGSLPGIDLPAILRTLEARTGGKTDFQTLTGSFTIAQGIVHNDDLALKSALVDVTGKGTIDLPARRLSYRLQPKLEAGAATAVAPGVAGASRVLRDINRLSVPVLVSGPWAAPEIQVDAADAAASALRTGKPGAPAVDNALRQLNGLFRRR